MEPFHKALSCLLYISIFILCSSGKVIEVNSDDLISHESTALQIKSDQNQDMGLEPREFNIYSFLYFYRKFYFSRVF